MSTVEVLPGLVLDETIYGATADGMATYAPGILALTWEQFVAPDNWLLVPDDQGHLSKAELTVVKTAEQTVKVNVWFRSDLRGGDKPMPHDHPWKTFTGHVLLAGYDEDRWWVDTRGDVRADLGVRHASPAANTVDRGTYHEVTAIHEPGRTVSLMVCGPGERGRWGYLDIETGEHRRIQPVKNFDAMLAALNPHRR
ncbi:hypothetical protein [Saccharopolyspora sp. ASAGF58]|uniref:hypothetical protein n=1 Tax=Saccharopolyspora sp. ASAGF58 TaxID=2719023 RepID=UPI0014402E43|nr:hypothetical protein [Saccharopolyspora sp. ASAGF58]QIZ37835.1 hypothetical protein FDZ84_28735 [Saccharopolyspora sp. ASAGF58]